MIVAAVTVQRAELCSKSAPSSSLSYPHSPEQVRSSRSTGKRLLLHFGSVWVVGEITANVDCVVVVKLWSELKSVWCLSDDVQYVGSDLEPRVKHSDSYAVSPSAPGMPYISKGFCSTLTCVLCNKRSTKEEKYAGKDVKKRENKLWWRSIGRTSQGLLCHSQIVCNQNWFETWFSPRHSPVSKACFVRSTIMWYKCTYSLCTHTCRFEARHRQSVAKVCHKCVLVLCTTASNSVVTLSLSPCKFGSSNWSLLCAIPHQIKSDVETWSWFWRRPRRARPHDVHSYIV